MDLLHADPEIACATRFWSTTAALMYRRSLVEQIGGFRADLPVIQDARLLFDAACQKARFFHSAHLGARYRVLPASLSRGNPAKFWRDCLHNGRQIECHWRSRSGLTEQQADALTDIFNGAAHGLFFAVDSAFCDALAALRASTLPIAARNYVAELLWNIFGAKNAVRIAKSWGACRRAIQFAAAEQGDMNC